VNIVIVVKTYRELSQMIRTVHALRGGPHPLHCRQKEAKKEADYPYHYQQFNQRERRSDDNYVRPAQLGVLFPQSAD
jgi:hypothetical protein